MGPGVETPPALGHSPFHWPDMAGVGEAAAVLGVKGVESCDLTPHSLDVNDNINDQQLA